MEETYIRVGTIIYKVVQQPLADGTTTGENGGYPPTKNGDIRSLLCA